MAMKSLHERVQEYVAEDAKTLKRLSLSKQIHINFPHRRSVPLLSRVCIAIISKQGGILDTRMTSTK